MTRNNKKLVGRGIAFWTHRNMKLFSCDIFGFWLPFVGWRDLPADKEGIPCIEDSETGFYESRPFSVGSFLQFEWLGIGIIFTGSNYRPLA